MLGLFYSVQLPLNLIVLHTNFLKNWHFMILGLFFCNNNLFRPCFASFSKIFTIFSHSMNSVFYWILNYFLDFCPCDKYSILQVLIFIDLLAHQSVINFCVFTLTNFWFNLDSFPPRNLDFCVHRIIYPVEEESLKSSSGCLHRLCS